MQFNGYLRADGSVGIRNKVLIIAVDECMDGIARNISSKIDDSVVITNHATCMLGGNEETLNNMINIGLNPNIAGVLVIAMGCGSIDPQLVANALKNINKPVRTLTALKESGTKNSINQGLRLARELKEEAEKCERVLVDISKLIVGVKCGGSDTSSGLASNPSVGDAVDRLVDLGATVIAGELMELVGVEDEVCKRAVSPKVADKIRRLISQEEKRWSVGTETEVMSIGNCVGGLTTIEEKALGALSKTGTRSIQDILEINQKYHEKPNKPGMYLSDVTMLCGGSATHFAALGTQLILWTSGGAGFENSIVPVIRISGNKKLINDDIDIDATKIMRGEESSQEVGERIIDRVMEVADGKMTNVEEIGGYSYATLYQKDIRLEKCLGNI